MKYYLQVKNKTPEPDLVYKFLCDVDTKEGLALYQVLVPPLSGSLYDPITKKFVALMPAALTTAWTDFDTDQKKSVFLQTWSVVRGWAVSESPLDDEFPPWPGPV